MNYYLNLIEQKHKMYLDIISREKLVADDVVIAFPDVEAGWFDASIVVNQTEEYLFSFSDINEDIYDFVGWLEATGCNDNTQTSVYIDCEFERLAFTLEKLPTHNHQTNYASLGLLWWYNDYAEVHQIHYSIVNITQFVAKTYLALVQTAISKRFKILAWWNDEFMRNDDDLSHSEYESYEFLEIEETPELISNRLQLLFYNKIRRKRLDELLFDVQYQYACKTQYEIVDIVVMQHEGNKYLLQDLNGDKYSVVSAPEFSDDIIKDAIKLRACLPENIILFCSSFSVDVTRRAPEVNDQTPYNQIVPLLIPLGAVKAKPNFKKFC